MSCDSMLQLRTSGSAAKLPVGEGLVHDSMLLDGLPTPWPPNGLLTPLRSPEPVLPSPLSPERPV